MSQKPAAPILAILTLIAAAPLAGRGAAEETWSMEPEAIVYSDLSDLEVKRQEVLILNHGSESLEIVRVEVSCSACLSTQLSIKQIDPGESATLWVTFNPAGYVGKVEQSLAIITDHKLYPSKTLRVSATVVPAFDIRGGPVVFDELPADEVRHWNLYLRPHNPTQPKPAWVRSDYPGVVADIVATDIPGEVRVLIQTMPPQPEEGLVRSQLLLGLTGEREPRFAIPVLTHVVPLFHIDPSTLTYANRNSEQLRMVFIRQHGHAPCRLLDVLVPNAHFRAEVFPDSGLPNYRINIYGLGLAGIAGEATSIRLKSTCVDGIHMHTIPIVIQPASPER